MGAPISISVVSQGELSRVRPTEERTALSSKAKLGLAVLSALAAFVASPVASASITLYDQYDNAGTIATSSQNYEMSLNAYDDELADDFVVTDSSGWMVNQIEVDGQYFNGPGPATSANIRFYTDSGGLPGSIVTERLNVEFTQGPDPGDFVLPLTQAVPLGPGLYWVSVQANQNFASTGQWGWTDRTVSVNSGAAWRNPGNGYNTDCMAWGRRSTTCGIDAPAPDQVFRLLGNIGAGGPSLIHDLATVYDQDGDGYLEPGETFQLDERIRNTGGATATGITSVVSSSSSACRSPSRTPPYPDIPAGGTGTNTTRFEGAVSNAVVCGTTLNFSLAVTAVQGTYTVPFTIPMVPCPNYTITTQTGQAIVPGTADTGNHCDDCTTAIDVPVPGLRLRAPVQLGVASSRTGRSSSTATRACSPTPACPVRSTGGAIFPYWDDLLTDGTGEGIFTAMTGVAPNRVFYIEWRVRSTIGSGGTANFEAVLQRERPGAEDDLRRRRQRRQLLDRGGAGHLDGRVRPVRLRRFRWRDLTRSRGHLHASGASAATSTASATSTSTSATTTTTSASATATSTAAAATAASASTATSASTASATASTATSTTASATRCAAACRG